MSSLLSSLLRRNKKDNDNQSKSQKNSKLMQLGIQFTPQFHLRPRKKKKKSMNRDLKLSFVSSLIEHSLFLFLTSPYRVNTNT